MLASLGANLKGSCSGARPSLGWAWGAKAGDCHPEQGARVPRGSHSNIQSCQRQELHPAQACGRTWVSPNSLRWGLSPQGSGWLNQLQCKPSALVPATEPICQRAIKGFSVIQKKKKKKKMESTFFFF